MNTLILILSALAAPALAQVSVQEYPVPRGHYVHDVWADASPGGPVWFSAQRGGERRRDADRAADAPPGRAARVVGL